MNISNSLLQLLGSLEQAPVQSVAGGATQGSGLAALFGELLAAAQVQAQAPPDGAANDVAPATVAGEASPLTALLEAVEDLAAELGTVDGSTTGSSDTASLVEDVPEEVAAVLTALRSASSVEASGRAPLVVSAKPGLEGRSVPEAVPLPPPVQAVAPDEAVVNAKPEATDEAVAPTGRAALPALASAAAEAFPQRKPVRENGTGRAAAAQPPAGQPPEGRTGADVVAALRKARAPSASGDDGPPGLTVRQLLQEVVGQARREAPGQDAVAAQARAALAEALSADRPPDTRSPALDLATRPVPAGDVRPAGGGVVAGSQLEPQAQQVRVPESVSVRDLGDFTVRSVRYLSGRTDEVITVRLVPRSLGEMQVAVRSGGDGMEVVLTAATAAARDTIELQLGGLRDALARGGVDVTRVSVQTFTPSAGGHHTPAGQNGAGGRAPQYFESGDPGALVSEGDSGASAPYRPQHDGGLNMFV